VLRPTPPTFPVEQPIDLFPIRPTLYRLQYRLYIGQAKWSMGQLPKFSAYTGDLQGFLGDLLGGLAGYRPCRRPRYLLCGNLVGDIKDHDEPASDLGIGDLRIDLIVDLLLGCRSACYLASWPVAQQGRPFTNQCILTYAE
jgi:hypothetical protein